MKLFRLYRRLCADYIDYKVEYPRGHVSCWPDLVIKSTVEPKRCLILDVRESSLEVDRRVPGNCDEFPFPLPSCLYRAIFPHCCCNFRQSSIVRELEMVINLLYSFIPLRKILQKGVDRPVENPQKRKGNKSERRQNRRGELSTSGHSTLAV